MRTKAKNTLLAMNDNKPENRFRYKSWRVFSDEELAYKTKRKTKRKTKAKSGLKTEIKHAASVKPQAQGLGKGIIKADTKSKIYQSGLEAVFLILLGFTLTSMAALLYILATQQHSELIPLIIPAFIISSAALILMRSSIVMWLCLIAFLAWGGLATLTTYFSHGIPANQWLMTIPILLSLSLIAANYMRSKYLIIASLICAYLWLSIYSVNAELSALSSGTLLFIIGTAHHKLGKAMDDMNRNYSRLHTLTGWTAAITGLFWIQYSFMPMAEYYTPAAQTDAQTSFHWQLGIVLGLTVITIASLIRMRYKRLSALGLLGTLSVSLILPIMAFLPSTTLPMFENISQLPATPYLGFTIGAVILALAVLLIGNGCRRHTYQDIIIAGFAIFIQVVIVTAAAYITFDVVIMAFLTMSLVVCYEVMVARPSLLGAQA